MAARPPIDPAIFDAEVFGSVQLLISRERLLVHLQELERLMAAIAGATACGPGHKDQAHKVISQAGMLGLSRLSACAQALEDACDSGEGTATAFDQCCAAGADIRLYAMPAATAAG